MENKGYTYEDNSAEVKKVARKAAVKAIRDSCYAILADASNLVPHDTGGLEQTGDVLIDEKKLVGYIFFDTDYAIRQHEDMSARHPNGRQAKYLEKPLNERGPELKAHVIAEYKKALG